MAEINPTDAIPATNASNTTRYFNLPLFIATDKPSWLVDWNGAMNEIDSILQDINNSASGAESDVETVVTQVNQLSGVVSNLESLVQTAVSDVASMQTTVDSHEERMDGIETDLITQNNLIKSLSDAVTTMQATVGTLNSRVSAMETTVAGYDSRITSAEQASASASAIASEVQAGLTSLTNTVQSISSNVTSLNNRVTALETGGALLPYIPDLTFTPHDTNLTSQTTDQSNVTCFTATEDSIIKVAIGYSILSTDTSGINTSIFVGINDATGTPRNNVNIICGNCLRKNAEQAPVQTGDSIVVSGLYKIKAGDTVKYSITTTTEEIKYVTVFVAPIVNP